MESALGCHTRMGPELDVFVLLLVATLRAAGHDLDFVGSY